MLFVARCFDKYMKENGKLGFLVPFTLFKTQAGAGFRKFLTEGFKHKWGKEKEVSIQVVKVHDLVELYPFEGAVNRTAMLIIKKGKTQFPIPCTMWSNPRKENIPMEEELQNVYKRTKQNAMILTPIVEKDPMAPWMIISEKAYRAVKKIIGESEYEAYEGVNTALNGVYWLEIIRKEPNGVLIKNTQLPVHKKKVKEITEIIEPDLIYPLIRGEDVKKWYGKPSRYILIPTDSNGVTFSHSDLKVKYPKTYKYLYNFFKDLVNRGGEPYKTKLESYKKKQFASAEKMAPPFYWLFNVEPSLSPYKVVWKRIAGGITGKAVNFASCVITTSKDEIFEKEKPVIPNDSLILLPLKNKDEAFYVCGVLNSTPVLFVIASYTYELRMETHILNYVNIPKFDDKNKICLEISDLSQQAHELAKENKIEEVKVIEEKIDQKVAELYGITNEELEEIKMCLQLLKEGETEVEEKDEEIILNETEEIIITIEPLLIEENMEQKATLEFINNLKTSIENVDIKIFILNKVIAEIFWDRVKSKSKCVFEFILPRLKSGEYKISTKITYIANKEKHTEEVRKNLFVQKKKPAEKTKNGWDEEIGKFLE